MQLPAARVTPAIVIGTAIAWAVVSLTGAGDAAMVGGGFIPARFSGDVDFGPGMDDSWVVPAILTPLSATLLHGGLLHLGMNMLMLFWCGRFTEAVIGPRCLALLYGVGAYAAAGAQYLADPLSPVPMIGASGAISAVIGAYALLFNQNEVKGFGPFSPAVVRVLWLAAAWIGFQALVGLAVPGIAIAAHVGGFLAGLALARPLLLWHYRNA